MNKENRNNDLDKFFKSRIDGITNSESNWNVPGDDVLLGAFDRMDEASSNKKNKKKRFGWLLLLGFLGFAIVGSIVYSSLSHYEQLNNRINKLSDSLDNQQLINQQSLSTIEELKIQLDERELTQNLEELDYVSQNASIDAFSSDKILNQLSGTNDRTINISKKEETDLFKESLKSFTLSNSTESTNLTAKVFSKPAGLFANEKVVAIDSNKQLVTTALIGRYVNGLSLEKREMPGLTNFLTLEKKEQRKNSKYSTYLSAGHLYNSLGMSGMGGAYTIEEYDKFYHGWAINGGAIIKASNKISVDLSIGINSVKNRSIYKGSEYYESNNEFTNNQGQTIYRSNVTVQTPMGQFLENMEMDVTNMGLNEDEEMINKTEVSQKLLLLNLGGQVNYSIFSKNGFELYTSLGISINRALSRTQELDLQIYHDSEMMGRQIITEKGRDQMKPLFLGGNIGLNLKKSFSNNIFVQLGANYNQSLHSITASDNGTTTYLKGVNSSLLFGYQF